MSKLGQTLKGYFWWTYPRGSVHYDVMVTIILGFIFLAPLAVNFRDKPTPRPPRQTEVVVMPQGNGFLYRVDASAVNADNDADIRESLERVIEPVAGSVVIERYEPMRDDKHRVVAYQVWGHR
jgi:hypothetical protein